MLPGIIQTGKKQGMQLMDDALRELFDRGLISAEEAYARAEQKKQMRAHVETKNSNADAAKEAPSSKPKGLERRTLWSLDLRFSGAWYLEFGLSKWLTSTNSSKSSSRKALPICTSAKGSRRRFGGTAT